MRTLSLALALCIALWATLGVASAQAVKTDVSKSPQVDELPEFKPDFNGEAPSDIVAIGPKLFAIFHHVTGTVIFTDESGKQRSTAPMPKGFRIASVRNFLDRTVLVDEVSNGSDPEAFRHRRGG